MHRKKTGVYVEEHTDDGGPYKIWHADLWECPICGIELILGFGTKPIAHHFDSHYAKDQANVEYHIR